MTMNINGVRIHFLRKGSGKPILFVHGWGGTLNSLIELSSHFDDTHESILLDLPGFGKSGLPDPNGGCFDYADILTQFINKLKLKNIIYFGHSFGGSLGIILSATQPALVSNLILCNSAYKRTDKKSNTASLLKRLIYSIPVINSLGPILRRLGYALFFRSSDLFKYPKLESNFKKIMSEDLTYLLAKIKTKTLILWGKEDTQTPIPLAYELKEKIQNSQLTVFPDVKHNLPLVKPQEIAHEIKKFISS
jgi:pimeloyl-ACP methyl ester carboxylesterase